MIFSYLNAEFYQKVKVNLSSKGCENRELKGFIKENLKGNQQFSTKEENILGTDAQIKGYVKYLFNGTEFPIPSAKVKYKIVYLPTGTTKIDSTLLDQK
jgi:hypothetical protein